MNKESLLQLLDESLPDSKVVRDISSEFAETCNNFGHIELNGHIVYFPTNVQVTIITKAFFKEYLAKIGFGTYKVMVALGEMNRKKSGYFEAKYGFSTLYYDDNADFITIDFHSELR